MPGMLDQRAAIGKQAAWGTAPTAWTPLRYQSGTHVEWDAKPRISEGSDGATSRTAPMANRRIAATKGEGSAKLEVSLETAGMGKLLEAVIGQAVTTATGPGSQQVFTLAPAASYYGIQQYREGTNGVQVDTLLDAACKSFSLKLGADGGPLTLSSEWVSARFSASTAAVPAMSSTAAMEFDTSQLIAGFGAPTTGAAWGAGSLTLATTTALATGLSESCSAVIEELSVDHGLAGLVPTQCSASYASPAQGQPSVKAKLKVKFADSKQRDLYLSGAHFPMYVTATYGTTQVQIVLPDCVVDGGAFADIKRGEEVWTDLDALVMTKDVSTPAFQIVYRTTDTALA